MDGLLGNERELLARMIQAEAGNQGETGMRAVASVMDNRRRAQGYGGNTFTDVLLAPGQFSPANSITGYAGGEQGVDLNRLQPSETAYTVADTVMSGGYEDPTGGALNFLNPDISQPSWMSSMQNAVKIGDHLFGTAGSGEGVTGKPGGTNMQRQPQGLLGNPTISTQGQAPEQAPAQEEERKPFFQRPGVANAFDTLAMGLQGMTINPNEGLIRGAQQRIQQRREMGQMEQQRNRTVEALKQMDADPQLIQLAESGYADAALKEAIRMRRGGEAPAAIQSLKMQAELAGLQEGTPEYQEFMLSGGGDPAAFRALDRQARAAGFEPGTPKYQEFMATRGAGLSESAVLDARTEQGGEAAGSVAAGEEQVKRAFDALDQAKQAGQALGTIDEAIAAIDAGARSGVIENYLPNITQSSASLNNAMNRMGLDVISSVTFGALSEAEMRLAMETAAPRNLKPQALREWLIEKRDAQQKAQAALVEAARFLSNPRNKLSDWLDQQENGRPSAPQRGANDDNDPLGLR